MDAPMTATWTDLGHAPCGHDEDAIRVQATAVLVVFCQRCQRAYEGTPVPA